MDARVVTMRALTLYQPHASLMAVGEKKIETRSWPAPKTLKPGDWVAIHAAKATPPIWIRMHTRQQLFGVLMERHQLALPLPAGMIVGLVRFVECLPCGSGGLIKDGTSQQPISEQERILGAYGPDRWGWVFEDARPLRPTVTARGFQGLWKVPDHQVAQVFVSAGVGSEPWP